MSENNINNNTNEPEKQEDAIANYYEGVRDLEMMGYETGIRKARNTLFATAGLLLLGEIIAAAVYNYEWTPALIAIVVVEVGVFVALGFWTKTKPYAAVVTGLILFILLWIAGIYLTGGEAAYKGIIIKVVIIVYLAQALKPAKAWEDAKKNKI
jgi:uncharacterized membrane protein YqaE (UPF0057 family)